MQSLLGDGLLAGARALGVGVHALRAGAAGVHFHASALNNSHEIRKEKEKEKENENGNGTNKGERKTGGSSFGNAITDYRGRGAERAFANLCRRLGCTVRTASRNENMVGHFDCIVSQPERVYSSWSCRFLSHSARVEVKSIKCPRRGAPPDATLIYVELQSVGGFGGWVYGSADLIAFEQPGGFLIVPRVSLRWAAETVASKAPRVMKSGVKHTLYGRLDRNDLVVLLDRDRLVATLGSEAVWCSSCK